MASSSPSATPAPKAKSGPGCGLVLVLLPVVVIAGFVIGTLLNNKEAPNAEKNVTVSEGTIDGTDWRVDAVRDVQGDACVFLFADGEQLTGACTLTPQDATFGEETVVFGMAASADLEVKVELSDGQVVSILTMTAKGIDGRYYVVVVDGDLDATGLAS